MRAFNKQINILLLEMVVCILLPFFAVLRYNHYFLRDVVRSHEPERFDDLPITWPLEIHAFKQPKVSSALADLTIGEESNVVLKLSQLTSSPPKTEYIRRKKEKVKKHTKISGDEQKKR
jgi:hypothetical protein